MQHLTESDAVAVRSSRRARSENFLVGRLQQVWLCLFLPFFLLGLDNFLFITGRGPAPKYYYIVWAISGFLLFLPKLSSREILRSNFLWWSTAYIIFTYAWYLMAANYYLADDERTHSFVTVMIIMISHFFFRLVPYFFNILKIILWLTLLVGVSSITFDVAYPNILVPPDYASGSTFNIAGRAAGFYLNPNIAAMGILLVAMCLIVMEHRRYLTVITGISGFGVIMTFSRSGILAWMLSIIIFVIYGRISKRFIFISLVAVFAFVSFSDELLNYLWGNLDAKWLDSLNRVDFFLNGVSDESADGRIQVAWHAIGSIAEAPFLGHGLGYSYFWGGDVNTHNIYLKYALDFGLLGFLIFPSFIFMALFSSGKKEITRGRWAFAVVAAFFGFFSHNLMDQAIFLVPMLLAGQILHASPAQLEG